MNFNDGSKHFGTAGSSACFQGDKAELVIERLFHELVAQPASASRKLYTLWVAWAREGRGRCLQALAVMLRKLLKLPELDPLPQSFATLCLGWIMQGQHSQRRTEALAREALTLFRQINE